MFTMIRLQLYSWLCIAAYPPCGPQQGRLALLCKPYAIASAIEFSRPFKFLIMIHALFINQ